jgi:hypothetical protein
MEAVCMNNPIRKRAPSRSAACNGCDPPISALSEAEHQRRKKANRA